MEIKALKAVARDWLKALGPIKRNDEGITEMVRLIMNNESIDSLLINRLPYTDFYRYKPSSDLIYNCIYFTEEETLILEGYYKKVYKEYEKRIITLMYT